MCPFPVPVHQRLLFPIIRALIQHLIHRLVARRLWFTLRRLLRLLWSLVQVDWLLLLILQYYPELLLTKVPIDVASRGLGARGSYPIPLHIWDKLVPASLHTALDSFSPPTFPRTLGADTVALLHALSRDRFLTPLLSPARDTLTAFLRPKSTEKAAFIADLRALNALTPTPLPAFKLPSLEDLTHVFRSFPPGHFWGVTIDLTNFYWTLRLPPRARAWFRIHDFAFDSLPFGWNLSPIIAQETLGHLLDTCIVQLGFLPFYNGSLFTYRYLDDILLLGHIPSLLATQVKSLTSALQTHGLLVSPKSSLIPSREFTWLGKTFNLYTRAIIPTVTSTIRLLALAILFPLIPLHMKLLQRLSGVLVWSGRPTVGSNLFLQSLYYTMFHPPHLTHQRFFFATNKMCRCVFDFTAIAAIGWTAPSLPALPTQAEQPALTLFVDAAALGDRYCVGIFSPRFGIQFRIAPLTVTTQQMAELFGLFCGIQLATSLRFPHLYLVGDNSGSLYSLLHLRARASSFGQTLLLRRIFNLLWWSTCPVHLRWVPSPLHPADPPSRLFSTFPPNPFACYLQALSRYQTLAHTIFPSPFGLLCP